MRATLFLFGIVFALILLCGNAFADPNLIPGKWEYTILVEMPDMPPDTKIPPITYTQCVKEGDFVPKSDEAAGECEMIDVRVVGDTVSWRINCSNPGAKMMGVGKAVYHGDTMESTLEIIRDDGETEMKQSMTGRRIGNCD